MEFSIIIPNLNSPIINRTIEALEKQNYDLHKVEVIVVGLDETRLIPEKEWLKYDDTQHPLSPAAARNRGAAQAQHDILVFTDADCLPQPGWLSAFAKVFSDQDVSVVGGGVTFNTRNYWALSDNLSMFYEYLSIHPPGPIRKKVFEAVGGFDERYPRPAGEDADLTIRLRKSGYRLVFEPDAVVFHSPPRSSFPALLRHSYYQGMYSTKIDPRYAGEEGLPSIFRTRAGVMVFSPLLAASVTIRMFLKYPPLTRYFFAAPAIFASKIAWCLGAANHAF